jgi:hypothetical protein
VSDGAGTSAPGAAGQALRPRPASTVPSALLSPAELGATLDAGARPLGVVRGVAAMLAPVDGGTLLLSPRTVANAGYEVELWSSGAARGGRLIEDPVTEIRWNEGFGLALERLVAEARSLGAHGVVGIRSWTRRVGPKGGPSGVVEHGLMGTAVDVPAAAPPPVLWTTHLAGTALSQLVRSGWMPVSWVTALGAIRHQYSFWASTMRTGGGDRNASHLIGEVGAAEEKAVALAMSELADALGQDRLVEAWHRWESGGLEGPGRTHEHLSTYAVVGTRVRRFGEGAEEALSPEALTATVDLR